MADRRKIGPRDMVLTMAVVLIVVGLIALYGSQVTFAPGGATDTGDVPTASVDSGFDHASKTMDFPVAVPHGLPDDWHPNSFSMSIPEINGPGTVPTVRGGWVTPDGAFITLIESAGSIQEVLAAEIGAASVPLGSIDAGGATWEITQGVRDEAAWILNTGQTTMLITGDASDEDFATLASALGGAQ